MLVFPDSVSKLAERALAVRRIIMVTLIGLITAGMSPPAPVRPRASL